MALDLRQTLKLSQQLVMTPQLQQAIKLLQLNRLELSALLKTELLENPILEEDSGLTEEEEKEKDPEKESETKEEVKGEGEGQQDFDWENYLQSYSAPSSGTVLSTDDEIPSFENTMSKKHSLKDHLEWQLKLSSIDVKEDEIGNMIIGNLNDDGYLESDLEDIASQCKAEIGEVERVLRKIQDFDPLGVAARDLQECLILQTRSLENPHIIQQMIKEHLHHMEIKNYKAIQKAMGITEDDVIDAVKQISKLEPKPGRPFYDASAQYITPDIFIFKVGEKFTIALNEDGMPKLRISAFYKNVLQREGSSAKAKEYIYEKLKSAVWLIRSIHQRHRTIYKVAESIIKFQGDFLNKGISALKPMVLRDVAEDIDMHESTVSRVTTSKYVHTPQGIFELKFFFNSGIKRVEGANIASESVKDKIKTVVSQENQAKPYSDQDIVEILKKSNINIARRTVAKYREMLGILPSSKRKQLF
ncbi:MAG: RNA polymerase factor sigma-54 [Pseudomonadota bacterium]